MNLHLKVGRPSCRNPLSQEARGRAWDQPARSSRTLDGSGRALTSFSAPGNRRHRRRDGHPSRRTTGTARRREVGSDDSAVGSADRASHRRRRRAEDRGAERRRGRRRPRELHRDARERNDCVCRGLDEAVRPRRPPLAHLVACTKVAGASQAQPSATVTPATHVSMMTLAYSGVDTTHPVATAAAVAGLTGPTVTPTRAGSMLVLGQGSDHWRVTFVAPSGATRVAGHERRRRIGAGRRDRARLRRPARSAPASGRTYRRPTPRS